jgi:hypothetical protein
MNTAQVFDFQKYIEDHPPFEPQGVRFAESNDALVIDEPDGGVTIEFNPRNHNSKAASDDHNANLAEFIDDSALNGLAVDLIEGIEEDRRSFSEWLQTRANGVKLLGFKVEEPRSDLASTSAPLEGMSTVRHPLLGEACLHFQGNARRELIPSNGPAKVAVFGGQNAVKDWLAEKLESEINWYLTKKATEFIPGTDRLLFMVGFSGMAFKKVYYCPMRRRPVSEMVDAEHFVVANTTTDIQTAPRVTHIIPMQQTTFKRMQLLGVYRDVPIQQPDANINAFDAAVARSQGISLNVTRPEDQVHTIYECYADVDMPEFEHHIDGEPTGLPLPYRITIDLTSRAILEIRRDWDEGDEDFIRRRTFVPFGFAPTFGFYCTGLLQILGNATSALTGAWRLLLDAGMFSNFPGFLYAKNGAKQSNNTFRVPPGGGAPVDVPGGVKLADAIMPLPYKEPSAGLIALSQNIAQAGQKLGGTAELPTAEGKADVPVGTMLAAIEQAGKILNAVHTRLHDAQTIELELLLNHLRQHPEVLYRPDPDQPLWTLEMVRQALANHNLIPRSDPNTPSHAHRLMKAIALGTVAQQTPPGVFDPKKVASRVLHMMQIDDVDDLFMPPPPPGSEPPPNPEMIKAQSAAQANQAKLAVATQNSQSKMADIQARVQVEMAKMENEKHVEYLRLMQHLITHPLAAQIFGPGGDSGGQGQVPAMPEGFNPLAQQ